MPDTAPPAPISLIYYFTKGGKLRSKRVGIPGSCVVETGGELWTIPAAGLEYKPEVGSWFVQHVPPGGDKRKRTVLTVAKSAENLSYLLTCKVE